MSTYGLEIGYEKRQIPGEEAAEATRDIQEKLAEKAGTIIEHLFGRKIPTSSFRDLDPSEGSLTFNDGPNSYAVFNTEFSRNAWKDEFDLWGRTCKSRFNVLREAVDYETEQAGYIFRGMVNG